MYHWRIEHNEITSFSTQHLLVVFDSQTRKGKVHLLFHIKQFGDSLAMRHPHELHNTGKQFNCNKPVCVVFSPYFNRLSYVQGLVWENFKQCGKLTLTIDQTSCLPKQHLGPLPKQNNLSSSFLLLQLKKEHL